MPCIAMQGMRKPCVSHAPARHALGLPARCRVAAPQYVVTPLPYVLIPLVGPKRRSQSQLGCDNLQPEIQHRVSVTCTCSLLGRALQVSTHGLPHSLPCWPTGVLYCSQLAACMRFMMACCLRGSDRSRIVQATERFCWL